MKSGTRVSLLALALGCSFSLIGCSSSSETPTGSGNTVAATTGDTGGTASTGGTPASTQTTPPAAPADSVPVADRKPKDGEEVAVMETSKGRIVLMFFPDKAPKTVENIKKLAKKGFYDGIKFHRVIPGFMIQGGDPNTKTGDKSSWGSGGPGYTVDDEFTDVDHLRGIVSMANTGAPNSGGSQFYIVVKDSSFLNGKYSAFGKVISGMDVADKIVNVPVISRSQPNAPPRKGDDQPIDPPVIKSLKIVKWPVK